MITTILMRRASAWVAINPILLHPNLHGLKFLSVYLRNAAYDELQIPES